MTSSPRVMEAAAEFLIRGIIEGAIKPDLNILFNEELIVDENEWDGPVPRQRLMDIRERIRRAVIERMNNDEKKNKK